MDELLKLFQEKESRIGDYLMSFRMFADGSGFLLSETDVKVFNFDSIEELIEYLKK